jgi:ATP-dependent protease HslVU (ClpYQ) peptidase subunit
MTCIVGMVCPKTGNVYMGGDSAGVSGYSLQIRTDEKVFRTGPFLMGFTTSFRMGQLLRYDLEPPEHPTKMSSMQYMVTRFIPTVRELFKGGGFQKLESGVESGGTFLVGYRNQLYNVQSDYQIAVPRCGMDAVGCGFELALGAMAALTGQKPQQRIRRALEITAEFNIGVRAPFKVLKCPT